MDLYDVYVKGEIREKAVTSAKARLIAETLDWRKVEIVPTGKFPTEYREKVLH